MRYLGAFVNSNAARLKPLRSDAYATFCYAPTLVPDFALYVC